MKGLVLIGKKIFNFGKKSREESFITGESVGFQTSKMALWVKICTSKGTNGLWRRRFIHQRNIFRIYLHTLFKPHARASSA